MYTIKKVTENPSKSMLLFQTTWLVEKTVRFNELRILENAVIIAPEGKYVTLTVDGVGKQIKKGTYKGDVVLSVSDNILMPSVGLMRFNEISRNLHTAIVVEDGKISGAKGVPAIVYGGEVTDEKAEGVYIASEEESFNGIVVSGKSEYLIKNSKIDFEGFSDNDFLGVGTCVTASGDSKVRIEDSQFTITGVTRCAVHAGGNSEVYVKNCDIINLSPDTHWLGDFSWQVGFCGSNRLAQLTDNATVTYDNCRMKTNGWGISSIDGSDDGVKMLIKDSHLELSGPRAHGYGAFCIGDNEIVFDHSVVDVYGYPMLVMGMEGKGRPSIINGSVIKGRRFGTMVVSDDNSIFTISDSTFETDKSSIAIKGSATTINITNTKMVPKNGVIVQLMDTDESGMDVQEYKIPVGVTDVALPGRDLSMASDTEDIIINIADCDLKGDFFNSTTNIRAYRENAVGGRGHFHDTVIGLMTHRAPEPAEPRLSPVQQRHNGDDLRGPKNLGLNLKNTKIEGAVSSASQKYRDGLTLILEDNRNELTNVTQAAAETVNNGVVISLDKDSAWTVTGASYITALDIADGSAVKAAAGKALKMTIDGAETSIKPGSYKGKIVLEVM